MVLDNVFIVKGVPYSSEIELAAEGFIVRTQLLVILPLF